MLPWHASMGPVPQVSSVTTWDWSHTYLRGMHGTGPIGLSEQNLGLHTVIKVLWSSKVNNNVVWDRSHTFMRGMHGTGPKDLSITAWDFILKSCHESSMKSQNWKIMYYGTSPIANWVACMGPVPFLALRHTWDQSPQQTFRPLLGKLGSWNLAETLTRQTWLR